MSRFSMVDVKPIYVFMYLYTIIYCKVLEKADYYNTS